MKLTIIDEKGGNPFPHAVAVSSTVGAGSSPYSTDGYAENDEAVDDTARKLAQIIGLAPGQRTIDIGYGSCLAVAAALKEMGMDAYGLDSQDGLDKTRFDAPMFVPPYFHAEQRGVKTYCGTIEELLHPESELKGHRFDLFTFWGSWDSAGNNFAVGGEMAWFRAVKEAQERYGEDINVYTHPAVDQMLKENRGKILSDCKSALNPDGRILIVSSRYAYHGAGYTTDKLPREKRMNLELVKRFRDLGAKEVYLIGLSKEKVTEDLDIEELSRQVESSILESAFVRMSGREREQLPESEKRKIIGIYRNLFPYFEKVLAALTDDDFLFSHYEQFDEKYPPETAEAVKAMQIPLGRIDAVYARF